MNDIFAQNNESSVMTWGYQTFITHLTTATSCGRTNARGGLLGRYIFSSIIFGGLMLIRPFKAVGSGDVAEVGGKGASLGEMTQSGIPVPPGFVITSHAFSRFLQESNLLAEVLAAVDRLNAKNMESIELVSSRLRSLIQNASMPLDIASEIQAAFKKLFEDSGQKKLLVAVRSSATAEDSKTASWAGELETFLNTTKDSLLENVQKCWSSLFTPRALMYGCEQQVYSGKFKTCPVQVAVVVQQMIQSYISGITFTVHPVTEDRNQMIIEAGWGLGEAIVGGHITPDSYIIDKRDWSIIEVSVSEQEQEFIGSDGKSDEANQWVHVPASRRNIQKLTAVQIVELAILCGKIEKHYKFPCDIEWAFVKEGKLGAGTFYITQSRPITTLKQ